MKIFLICPVRNASADETAALQLYVEWLEKSEHIVYWPARDTDQTDAIGLRICRDNRAAIENADAVHVWWNAESRGSLFDLGMAFALRKVICCANPIDATESKSFNNVLRALQPRTDQ